MGGDFSPLSPRRVQCAGRRSEALHTDFQREKFFLTLNLPNCEKDQRMDGEMGSDCRNKGIFHILCNVVFILLENKNSITPLSHTC